MFDYKCNREMYLVCENSSLCHLCDGVKLYKNTKEERSQKEKQRELNKLAKKNALFKTHNAEKKEGMAFEKQVVKKWNDAYAVEEKAPTFKHYDKKRKHQKPRLGLSLDSKEEETPPAHNKQSFNLNSIKAKKTTPIPDARQQKNSGALWYAKGDVITEDYLMECKERGTVNGRGEKTISIPKEWLVKQEKEAYQENRPNWVLPFKYKNDNEIYLIKSFDQEIEMYQELRALREEVSLLKKQLEKE